MCNLSRKAIGKVMASTWFMALGVCLPDAIFGRSSSLGLIASCVFLVVWMWGLFQTGKKAEDPKGFLIGIGVFLGIEATWLMAQPVIGAYLHETDWGTAILMVTLLPVAVPLSSLLEIAGEQVRTGWVEEFPFICSAICILWFACGLLGVHRATLPGGCREQDKALGEEALIMLTDVEER